MRYAGCGCPHRWRPSQQRWSPGRNIDRSHSHFQPWARLPHMICELSGALAELADPSPQELVASLTEVVGARRHQKSCDGVTSIYKDPVRAYRHGAATASACVLAGMAACASLAPWNRGKLRRVRLTKFVSAYWGGVSSVQNSARYPWASAVKSCSITVGVSPSHFQE